MKHSSERCSIALRVQCSLVECSVNLKDALDLSRVQRSLEGCDGGGGVKASVVQLKDMRPWRPEFGPEG